MSLKSITSAPKHSRRPGISSTELARLADCNQSTVSRALADDPRIGVQTRERIQALARQHGYRSNRLARSLLRGHDGTLAFIVPDCNNPVHFALMRELDRRCAAAGLRVFLADSQDDSAKESRWIDYFLERRVAAMLIVPVSDIEADAPMARFEQLRDEQWPFIVLGPVSGSTIPHVCGQDFEIGQMLGRHLLDKKVEQIVYFASHLHSSVTRARLGGLGQALGGRATVEQCQGADSPSATQAAAESLAGRKGRRVAAVFEGVLAAMTTLAALRSHDVRVPHDLLAATLDGVPDPALMTPALTHIVMPHAELLDYAVGELLRQMADPDYQPVSRRFPGQLVALASSARP